MHIVVDVAIAIVIMNLVLLGALLVFRSRD